MAPPSLSWLSLRGCVPLPVDEQREEDAANAWYLKWDVEANARLLVGDTTVNYTTVGDTLVMSFSRQAAIRQVLLFCA